MTWHPLTLAIWLLDGLAAVFYLAAAARLLAVLPGWNPEARDRLQLSRERGLELVVHQGRWVLVLQAMSFLLLVVAVGNVWPDHVPGAMCGLGVMQAMGAAGNQTLFLRLALLGLLFAWHSLEKIARRHPLHQAVGASGRLLLLSGPLLAAGAWTFLAALRSIRPDQPVSCCATVYAQAGRAAPALEFAWQAVDWVWPAGAGAVVVLLYGAYLWFRPRRHGMVQAVLGVAALLLWLPLAVVTIKFETAPYLLEVLFHPCPWCLLLGEHGALGFALFGALAWTGAEAIAAMTAGAAARRHPALVPAAGARLRSAGRGIVCSTLLFLCLAALPALIWRLRFGGWMT